MEAATPVDDQILRVQKVAEKVGLGKSTIWAMHAQGRFPKAVRLGPNAVGWRLSEINRWMAERPTA